jgi:DNA repair protein RadC
MIQVELMTVREIEGELSSPKAVAELARKMLMSKDKEHFLVFHLDVRNKIVSSEVVSMGIVSEALVHPREVFRSAVVSCASRIILAHNHPTGETTPSREDYATTDRLRECGLLLGIEVVDHVVVTDTEYHSIRETGAWKKIKQKKI